MRKLSKKAIVTLIFATLVFGLSGCGSQSTAAPKSTQTEKAPEAQKSSETQAPAGTAKPAETAKPAGSGTSTTAPGAPAVEEEDCGC